jgi:hypothetical protein
MEIVNAHVDNSANSISIPSFKVENKIEEEDSILQTQWKGKEIGQYGYTNMGKIGLINMDIV